VVSFIRQYIVTLTLLLLVSVNSYAIDTLTASVDRNPVMERESFILKIQADDSVNTNDLDLSSLYSSGFIVGRIATGSQTQIINGDFSKSTTWSIVLTAKGAGDYTIPAFSLKGKRSNPITIKVIKSTQSDSTRDQKLFVKNEITQTDIYVQQTIKLTTKLFISPQVELQSGSLSEPVLEGAFIQQQGKDKDMSEIVNGIRYRVIERVYTITPQASGDFTIKSPSFTGDIVTVSNNRSRFSAFKQSRPVTKFGEDFNLTVKPIPPDYSGAWLPSTVVQLNEEWQPDKDTFKVGEAITRTITLTAVDVNEEQLPDIAIAYPDSVKVYPDQAETASAVRRSSLVSQKTMSEAIIPNQAGKIELPEIKVSWFNTIMKRQQTATLPARVITVLPADNKTANMPSVNALQNGTSSAVQGENEPQVENDNSANTASLTQVNMLVLWSGWLVALVLAIIVAVLLMKLKQRSKTNMNLGNASAGFASAGSAQNNSAQAFNIKELKASCIANQPNQAYQLLSQWLSIQYPGLATIEDIKEHLNASLQREINLLLATKYATQSNSTTWQGAGLWQAIEEQLKRRNTQIDNPAESLPPLN
jgi:hypothetical protein